MDECVGMKCFVGGIRMECLVGDSNLQERRIIVEGPYVPCRAKLVFNADVRQAITAIVARNIRAVIISEVFPPQIDFQNASKVASITDLRVF